MLPMLSRKPLTTLTRCQPVSQKFKKIAKNSLVPKVHRQLQPQFSPNRRSTSTIISKAFPCAIRAIKHNNRTAETICTSDRRHRLLSKGGTGNRVHLASICPAVPPSTRALTDPWISLFPADLSLDPRRSARSYRPGADANGVIAFPRADCT